MKQQNNQSLPEYLAEFPPDTSVRLAVTGLAFCTLTCNISTINFLRHLADHTLKMSIFRRRQITDPPQIVCLDLLLDGKTNVSVTTTAEAPSNAVARTVIGEYGLTELINLTTIHNEKLIQKSPPAGALPTSLIVENFQYYTLELMKETHALYEGTRLIEAKEFGYSLGGKLKLSNSDSLTIEIGTAARIKLPASEDSKLWLYDLYFSNQCELDPEVCSKPPGDGLDFQYYYDVLCEEEDPQRIISLKVEVKPSAKIAACNVVLI